MLQAIARPRFWAFDIECADWTHLLCAVAVADDGTVFRSRSRREVAEWYKNLPPEDVVWAHNGGAYDFIFLIEATPGLTWSARMAGSDIVSCRAAGHAECRDSIRLFPLSLAKWTGRKISLADMGLPCQCGEACGGYKCRLRPDMSAAELAIVEEYCEADCLALLSRLREDLERLESVGLDLYTRWGLRLTVGAVAWATAARMAGLRPGSTIDKGDYHAGRLAYYGGRVEVGRVFYDRLAYRYDVRSMYPAMLLEHVPHGRRRRLNGPAASNAYRRGEHGAYTARVVVPESDLPLLPSRVSAETGDPRLTRGRLVWACGTIEGTWSLPELQYAEAAGAKIESIESAALWSDYSPLYAPYIERIYEARRRAIEAGDDRWSGVMKLYANALSGKLAQRPGLTEIVVLGDDEHEDDLAGEGYSHVAGRVWSREVERIAPNARPIEAAYLTSRARIKLLDRLRRHSGAWLYCDTDSAYTIRADSDVGDGLGEWVYEGTARKWRALAPKTYRYVDGLGVRRVRAKGVPRATWEDLDALARGETIMREGGVERLRTGGGAFTPRVISRSLRDATSGRCGTRHVDNATGVTRPLFRRRDGTYV